MCQRKCRAVVDCAALTKHMFNGYWTIVRSLQERACCLHRDQTSPQLSGAIACLRQWKRIPGGLNVLDRETKHIRKWSWGQPLCRALLIFPRHEPIGPNCPALTNKLPNRCDRF